MGRTSERLIKERMRSALILIAERSRAVSGASGGAVLSQMELAGALGLSVSQVRCVVRRLAAEGLVAVVPRHLSNGGQLENSFHVTPAGISFLLDARKGAPCGKEQEVPATVPFQADLP